MARLELNPGFEAEVLRRIAQPAVDRAKRDITDGARKRAPTARVWVTEHDERVRSSHADADGQIIPGNLRFKLKRTAYSPAGGWHELPGYDMGRHPRDEALPAYQAVNCRCEDPEVPDVFARSIVAGPTVIEGLKVRATVETRFPRAAESEFGTGEDHAARFMRGALDEVAVRFRR